MKIKPMRKTCYKVQFPTAKAAYEARERAVKSGANYDGTRAYRCKWCAGRPYHLGHPEKEQ